MDVAINIEKLIKVIKKRPTLYVTSSKDYYDRFKRRQLWEEVCSTMHPTWDSASEKERMLYEKEVHKKWQSLRDCFRRELVAQNNPVTTGNTKRRAKYKYFDDLEFLTPFTQCNINETSEQDDTEKSFSANDLETSSNTKDPLADYQKTRKRKRIASDVEEDISVPIEINEVTERRNYSDDDEAFLMSLLPGFKEYSWEEKCLLRIEMMQTMLKFKAKKEQGRMISVKFEVEREEEEDSS